MPRRNVINQAKPVRFVDWRKVNMTLRTEKHGDAIFVYSVEQEQVDEEASAVGIATLRHVDLSDGRQYINGEFEIKPNCPPEEIGEVRKIMINHISS